MAKLEFQKRFSCPNQKKVLITGATGFIGRALTRRLLSEGVALRFFVRRLPEEWLNNPNVEISLGDLGDPEAVARAVSGIEIIYHVGAAMSGGEHDFRRGTIVGTQNIVDCAIKEGVKKIIYVSSLSVLHASLAKKNQKVTEDWPLEPHPEKRGHYTLAKLEAEKIITRAIIDRGLNAVILRPGQVFGPGAPVLTPAVARRVKNFFVVLGDGKLILPLVYVEDVIDGILQAAQSDMKSGLIFQLVDSVPMTQDEFLADYIRQCGITGKVVHVPFFFVCLMALGIELLAKFLRRSAPLSMYRVKSALAPISFDCSAAKREIQWSPRVGVTAGLEKTFSSLKS